MINVVADATGLYFIFTLLYFIFTLLYLYFTLLYLCFIITIETVLLFSLPFVLCVKVENQAANRSKHTGCMQSLILYRVSQYIPTTA